MTPFSKWRIFWRKNDVLFKMRHFQREKWRIFFWRKKYASWKVRKSDASWKVTQNQQKSVCRSRCRTDIVGTFFCYHWQLTTVRRDQAFQSVFLSDWDERWRIIQNDALFHEMNDAHCSKWPMCWWKKWHTKSTKMCSEKFTPMHICLWCLILTHLTLSVQI